MITNVTSRISYDGDGVTDDFPVPFKFFLSSDLEVIERDETTGAETVLTEGTHYTVSGGGGATGTVTAEADYIPSSNEKWIITRDTPRTQQSDYVNDSQLSLDTIEADFDRNAMRDIEIDRELTKSLKIPESDDPAIGQEIPNSVDRASMYLGFDSDGQPIALSAPTDTALTTSFSESLLDDGDAATARATLEAQEDVVTTRGDLVRGDSAGDAERYAKGARGSLLKTDANDVIWLAIGQSREVLKSDGVDPAWGAPWDENAVINGCCRVGQRAAATLVKDTWAFGMVDRMEGMATGTAVSAGDLTQDTDAAVGTTGYAAHFDGFTLTGTGILYLRTRIEHKDAVRYIDGPATFKCAVRHDVGSGVDFTVTVSKADAQDDFSSTTEIDNDGGTSVASATNTELEFTISDMGSCGNGIEIEIKIEVGEITTKDVWITEMQLVPRLSAPDFSWRAFEDELRRCKRYYQVFGGSTGALAFSGTNGVSGAVTQKFYVPLIPEMRDTPTVSKSGDWTNTNCSEPSAAAADTKGFGISTSANADSDWAFAPTGATDIVECDAEL